MADCAVNNQGRRNGHFAVMFPMGQVIHCFPAGRGGAAAAGRDYWTTGSTGSETDREPSRGGSGL